MDSADLVARLRKTMPQYLRGLLSSDDVEGDLNEAADRIEEFEAQIARLQEQVESVTLDAAFYKAASETLATENTLNKRMFHEASRAAEAAEAEGDRLREGCRIYAASLRGSYSARYEVAEGLEILAALQKEPQP